LLVAVVGLDGAGKSTVVQDAALRLTAVGHPARPVDRWDVVDNPAYPTARFLKANVKDIRTCVAAMPGPARLLFLLWLMSMALSAEQRERSSDEVVLLDGYWMKHAASEIAYGLERGWVETMAAGLPLPDLVLYLRLPPNEAWGRKRGDLVPYECGMDPACTEASFLAHQRRIYDQLEDWSVRFRWSVIDASAPAPEVAARVVDQLLRFRDRAAVRRPEACERP